MSPLELLKRIYLRSYLSEEAIQECCQKLIVPRSSYRDVFFNTAVLTSLKNFFLRIAVFCKVVCNAFLLLSTGAEELYFITTFCRTATFVEHLSRAASLF